jgi:hypothetical protein
VELLAGRERRRVRAVGRGRVALETGDDQHTGKTDAAGTATTLSPPTLNIPASSEGL